MAVDENALEHEVIEKRDNRLLFFDENVDFTF